MSLRVRLKPVIIAGYRGCCVLCQEIILYSGVQKGSRQDKTGQDRTGQDRTGQGIIGQDRVG